MVVQTKLTPRKQSKVTNAKQSMPTSIERANAGGEVSIDVNKLNDPNHLLYLQRTIGNRATQDLVMTYCAT